jgi:hypothetical protein
MDRYTVDAHVEHRGKAAGLRLLQATVNAFVGLVSAARSVSARHFDVKIGHVWMHDSTFFLKRRCAAFDLV